jgi:hypothetical protein
MIPVLDELPPEYTEEPRTLFRDLRRAYRRNLLGMGHDSPYAMHYCPKCGGWIPGEPHGHEENTLGILSGRRGMVYNCRRCDAELEFHGVVA